VGSGEILEVHEILRKADVSIKELLTRPVPPD
jgi:hypothetical protein